MEILKLRYSHHDRGYDRHYYVGKGTRKIYCTQLDLDGSEPMYACSKTGEPEYRIEPNYEIEE